MASARLAVWNSESVKGRWDTKVERLRKGKVPSKVLALWATEAPQLDSLSHDLRFDA
jgi:hypothetical protein